MRSEESFRRGDIRDEYVFPEHAASKETLEAVRFFFFFLYCFLNMYLTSFCNLQFLVRLITRAYDTILKEKYFIDISSLSFSYMGFISF